MSQYSELRNISPATDDDGDARHYSSGSRDWSKTPSHMQQFECLRLKSRKCSALDRIGWTALTILAASFLLILGAVGFLVFLWTGKADNLFWHAIMLRQWATRAVTITALAIRTCTSLQAGIAVAMLASLLLESSRGTRLMDAPMLSVARATETVSISLLKPVLSDFDFSNALYSTLLVLLVATSTILQFSSTVLVTDLTLGQIPGIASEKETNYTYSRSRYDGSDVAVLSSSRTWSRPPPAYPAFAEHSAPITVPAGVDDTGELLRAFLPYRDARSRETLHSYSGEALVLDSRVSCQPPQLKHLSVSGVSTQAWREYPGLVMEGSLLPSRNVTGLWSPSSFWYPPRPIGFNCSFPIPGPSYLCEINQDILGSKHVDSKNLAPLVYGNPAGSLVNMFSGTDAQEVNTMIRVYNESQGGIPPYSGYGSVHLLYLPYNTTPENPELYTEYNSTSFDYEEEGPYLKVSPQHNDSYSFYMTLCHTAWTTASLSVEMYSDSNRSEPEFENPYRTTDVARQLGVFPNSTDKAGRGILDLSTAGDSWVVDNPLVELGTGTSFVKHRADGSLNLAQSTTENLNPTIAFNFRGQSSYFNGTRSVFEPHKTLNILYDVLWESSNSGPPGEWVFYKDLSPARTLSALITLVSSMGYYEAISEFDESFQATQAFFMTVLFPRSYRGLIAFLAVLVIHLLLVATSITAFVMQSQHSFVGNYWQAIAQLRSPETEALLVDSMLKDKEVAQQLERSGEKDVRVGLGSNMQHEAAQERIALVRRRPMK